jgi:hypothetical protein
VSFQSDAAREQQHLELVVELKPGADRGFTATWFERRGLATLPLVSGVLVTGDAEALRDVFGGEPTGMLAVPHELADHVASIVVAPPKQWHEKVTM